MLNNRVSYHSAYQAVTIFMQLSFAHVPLITKTVKIAAFPIPRFESLESLNPFLNPTFE